MSILYYVYIFNQLLIISNFVVGSGGDRDNLEPEQRLGGTVGRLEGEPIYRAPDREHGELVSVHLQEAQQDEQGTQGEGNT